MNIEKLKEMNWKEKRNLAETANDMQLLITLADEKSVRVKRAILSRKDVPIEVIEKLYDNFEKSYDRLKVFNAIRNLPSTEKLRKLLSKMVSDSNNTISRLAIEFYRAKFKKVKSYIAEVKKMYNETNPEFLEDWAIQIPGHYGQGALAENLKLTGENAHKFVVTMLVCEKNLEYIQRNLYSVFSHEGILAKTAQHVFEKVFMDEYEECDEGFYINPKYAVAGCDKATPEMLDELMDRYERAMKFYVPEYSEISGYNEFYNNFAISLVRNPNISQETYNKAFELFVKCYKLEWVSVIEAFAMSEHLTKEQLIYILEHSNGYFIHCFSFEKLNMLTENEFAKIVSGYTNYTKNWIKNHATSIPSNFMIYLSK